MINIFTGAVDWPLEMQTAANNEASIYHYTDEKGLLDILTSGVIKATELKGRDAFHGEGVYLTGLAPDRGENAILINNYDRKGWGSYLFRFRFRADCYVKFEVAELKGILRKRRPGDGKDRLNRDIWLFPGSIELKYYPHCWLSHDFLGEIYADRKAFNPAGELRVCLILPAYPVDTTLPSRPLVTLNSLIDWDGLEENDDDDGKED